MSTVGPRQLRENNFFFCTTIFKMAATSYNAEVVLQLLEEDNSEFPDSVSSGRKEMRSTLIVDLVSVPMNQNTAALTPKLDGNISDPGKLIF